MISRDVAWFERRGPLHARSIIPTSGQALSVSEQRFTIDRPLGQVFRAYRTAPPQVIWPRERILYRCAYAGERRFGPDESWGELALGLRVFCDLLLFSLRIFVPVEVTKIEPEREIRYDYLDGAVTMGWNSVLFEADGTSRTRLRHYSEYRGTSLRDRLLMPLLQPLLHVGFVNALHGNMKRRIEAGEL